MHYQDLSRSDDIGANCSYLSIGPFNILIDAGIHPKKIGLDCIPNFGAIPKNSLDFIILTHCHLDHLGALPLSIKGQPQAEVLLSHGSMHLAPRMLSNSHRVMTRQREELGIKEYPLYTQDDIKNLEERFSPMPLLREKIFSKGDETISITFHPSGHIPGACGIAITYKNRKIFFTGDVLFKDQMTVPGAAFPQEKLDTLIMETTRGLTQRAPENSRENEISRLINLIDHTIKRGGSILIPVFALGRMQEILAIIHDAVRNKRLKKYPLYCSGLGLAVVDILDEVSKKSNHVRFRKKILHELKVKTLPRKWKPTDPLPQKGIYLVSSGMLVEHTPSYRVAASLIDDPHSTVCFVGYCDPDTPGGIFQATAHGDGFHFETLGKTIPIRAHVERLDISGHADREELLNYALKTDPRIIVLTHGDPAAREWFMDQLLDIAPHIQVVDPADGEMSLI